MVEEIFKEYFVIKLSYGMPLSYALYDKIEAHRKPIFKVINDSSDS